MTCFYKLKKSKFVKKLFKLLEKPEEYLETYKEFLDLFRDRKHKKDKYKDITDEELEELFNNYLKSKGLKRLEEIILELELRARIIQDKNSLYSFDRRLAKLEGLLETLQENMLVVLRENQILKDKLRGVNILAHKTIKPRAKQVNNN